MTVLSIIIKTFSYKNLIKANIILKVKFLRKNCFCLYHHVRQSEENIRLTNSFSHQITVPVSVLGHVSCVTDKIVKLHIYVTIKFSSNRLNEMRILKFLNVVNLRSRSRSQVRSGSGPRSGPKGPRTKDQRPGPGLTLYLVCHPPTHPLTTTKLFLGR